MNEQVERIIARIERLKDENGIGLSEYDAGYCNAVGETCDKILSFIRSMSEGHNDSLIDSHNDNVEPASKDLDEEINAYLKVSLAVKFPTLDIESIKADVRYIARHFAEWQKQQMMKEAMECVVAEGGMCPAMESIPVLTHTDMIQLPKDKFKIGDKVKLIIIKE